MGAFRGGALGPTLAQFLDEFADRFIDAEVAVRLLHRHQSQPADQHDLSGRARAELRVRYRLGRGRQPVGEMDDAAGTGAGSIESYKYMGVDTIVQRTEGSGTNQTALSYIKQTGDSLAGSDAGDRASFIRWRT
jgi:hypothetical protein